MITPFNSTPLIIAHRGGSAYAPENTMAAFVKAAQRGIKWVEFDVMLAADGEPIIFHDETLDRTTNGRGQVTDYPYVYLRTLDAGAWFNPFFSGEIIPSLKQVLTFLSSVHVAANIEIKPLPGKEEEVILSVLAVVDRYCSLPHSAILFSSFSVKSLQFLRKHAPNCLIGLLLSEWLSNWQELVESLACFSVHVEHRLLTLKYALELKASGERLLGCYTINDPARAQELCAWGVDMIFSDVPDKIALALADQLS